MRETNIIQIEEQQALLAEGQAHSANLIFNCGERYPCQIRDPFADEMQRERELEWYFEEYLTFPLVPAIRARNAAEDLLLEVLKGASGA